MLRRFAPAAVLVSAAAAAAQTPPPPRTLPPLPVEPGSKEPSGIGLPRPENFTPIDAKTVRAARVGAGWQVTAGGTVLRDLGDAMDDAQEIARVVRELRPVQWAAIGTGRVVVEYGLTTNENGITEPPKVGGFPKTVTAIDLRTVRAEQVRGAWCLRDDANLLLNFGSNKHDAEQAAGVVRKYAFNRLGFVGRGTVPAMTYFFAHPDATAPGGGAAAGAVPVSMQERAMTRTGIEVPGLGYVGEKVTIDPRAVVSRRDKGEWVLAAGQEVLAKFGGNEWAARDAARVVQDGRFTEFCRFGTAGVSFFLSDGAAPTKVPFSAQAGRFDPAGLRVREMGGKWWVYEAGGRALLPAGTAEEADQLVRVIKAYKFDMLCQTGLSPTASLRFLAKAK